MGNTPNIRFKGYTDDWEQRKLGAVVEDYVEKTTVEDQYPVLTSSQQKGIVLQDDYFSGDRVSQNGNVGYFIIPRGYFAFRSRSDNDVFVFNRNDVADMGIISYFYPVFKPKGVDSDFLLRRLNYGLEDQIKINSEGTGQHVLSLKKFKNMVGLFPSYEEQKKVGSYFSKIDNLISRHQQEYDNMAALKKYMLQKMFPANGEKVPEIRFEGFTDLWEQRKLGDIIEFLDTLRKPLKETDREPGPYPYYGASGIVDYVADYIFDEELILLSEDGANITDRNYPVCFLATGKYWVNNHVHVLKARNKMDNNFICMSMERKDYSNYNTGMAMPKLNKDTCCQIPVDCPTFDEQKKIGAYFRKLDNLITLHQRKRDELLELKRYMLQNMFPKKEG